jgi:MFS family permease
MLFNTTLTVWIATQLAWKQSWAPLAVSGVLLAAALPVLLIGPLAGVFVDRAQKRRMMLAMDGLRAIVVALMIVVSGDIALPFFAGGKPPIYWTLGVIYAVVFIINAAQQFFGPASTSLIQPIVSQEQQPQAMGFMQMSVALASIIGPAIAAPLFVAFGAFWALLFNAASFVVSFLCISAIRTPGAPIASVGGQSGGFWKEFGQGVRFYFTNRVLLTLTLCVVVAVTGASALNTLDVFFTTQNLGASTAVYGLVGAVYGLGAVIGSIVIGIFAERLGLARLLWLSLAGMGVMIIVVSRMTSVGPALGLMFGIGFGNSALNIAASPLMMRTTPPALLGRVIAIFQPITSLVILLATALVGYLASVALVNFHETWLDMRFGPVDTIWGGGGVLIALSAIVVIVGLWGVDRKSRKASHAEATTNTTQPEVEVTA